LTPPELLAPIADDMQAMDAVVRQRLSSDIALINQIGSYIVSAGGKRLRPALVILFAQALGYAGQSHHELAAVVEFIHTATLLHDDVVDESSLRRGRKTANALFGNAASVLVGDFLYSRSFQMMVGVGSMPVMRILADATNMIAEGEVLQLMNVHDPDVTEESYLRVIRYKTAKLFEAAARLGVVIAGGSGEQEEAAAGYGRHVGTAFQLVDDMLDYSGNVSEIGKNLGDDLREGKPTLPLIHALHHGSAPTRQLVRAVIENGGEGDFERVAQAIRAGGALDYTHAMAEREVGAASAALAAFPDSKAKTVLLQLAAFAATRSH
jgi:octaprenyl-diphosphate synthase